MPINSIKRLRNCGIFRDFDWPSYLTPFNKYNLIYGWNGTGKTTISRTLRDLELNRHPSGHEVVLSVNDQEIRGVDFPTSSIPIRTFNRDFIADNVFPTTGGDVPPILVLGQQSIENQKWLECFRRNLPAAEAAFAKARTEKAAADAALDKHCIAGGGIVRQSLRGSGTNPYNSYDKSDYRDLARQMERKDDAASHLLKEIEIDNLMNHYRSLPKATIDQIVFHKPHFDSLKQKTEQLLSTTVVSQTIDSMKDDAKLSEWIRQGLELHRSRNASKCLYCDQTLPTERIMALESHFNAAYETLSASLRELTADIEQLSVFISQWTIPNRAQFYDYLVDEYDEIADEFEKYRESSKSYLNSLANIVAEKSRQPFTVMSLHAAGLIVPEDGVVAQIIEIIGHHNEACDNHAGKVLNAGQKIEKAIVAGRSHEFEELTSKIPKCETAITFAEDQVSSIRTEITRLEVEITEHRKPAEELNDDLRKYMGHEELHLEVKDGGYTLTRSGVLVNQLSEGEITAIGLLYFLRTLTDHRFDFANGIVVLDDPVSSLDENSLFLAFGFIQERTRNAGQVLILTHNFAFFRQVRNWFHKVKGQNRKDVNRRPCRFFMLNCRSDANGRYSSIEQIDSLLEHFESDYHYLFSLVVKGACSQASSLEANYLMPNVARRLLEAFLAFRQPDVPGDLWEKMQYVNFANEKKIQILRFLHTYSHNDGVGKPDHDLSLLSGTQDVLAELLQLIKAEDNRHFERMMNLVSSGNVKDDEDEE